MVSVSFTLRDIHSSVPTPIYCKVRYNGKTVTIATKKKVNPSSWNSNKQRVNGSHQLATEINKSLRKLEEVANEEFLQYENEHGKEPSKGSLKRLIIDKVLGNSDKENKIPEEIYEYINYFINIQEKTINPKTGRLISKRQVNDYKLLFRRLKEFEKDIRYTVTFESIDLEFYSLFKEYLESKNFQLNTIGKYIKNLKAILNDATAQGVNSNLKYKSRKFIKVKEETTEIYIPNEQLQELARLDLSLNYKLDNARNLLLVLCYTGQRYQSLSDVLNPNKRNNGKIELVQGKENNKVVIPIIPELQKILNQNLKLISNVKLNLYIKDVCKKIPSFHQKVEVKYTKGGKEIVAQKPMYSLVGTHTGRRSFATNFYKLGFPVSVITLITGHKKESSFFRYIRTTPEEGAQRFMELYRNTANTHLTVS